MRRSCGTGSRGQVTGSFEYRRLGNIPGLSDVQGVPALVELCAIAVRKREAAQDTVAVRNRGFFPVQGDSGRAAAGGSGKAGNLLRCLNRVHQGVILGREIRNAGFSGIVEDIAGGTAFVGGVAFKGGGVPQSTDNLVDQELSGNPQGYIWVAVLLCGGHADGLVRNCFGSKKPSSAAFPA